MFVGTSPVDEIKQRLDIAEVLSEYVKLKPSGPSRYKVLCPFHTEKTPSLMVSKDKQAWHCFGCGKGGDIFSFVQEIEGLEFPEALRLLAKKANVELRAVDPKLQSAKTKLLDILKLTAAFYRKVLTDALGGEVARRYLAERKVGEETAEDFQLGYSPTTWDGLLNFLVKKGYQQNDIFDAGLVVKREKGVGYYDRFRGRLMFPIRDANSTVVGFGGRVLEQTEGDAATSAKYINTPETLVYSKGSVLYGLDKARLAIKQADLAVLVEGYMDCLASHQAGVRNVAAVSGTALTFQQVKLLKRSTNNLALAFDADLAGGEAARRGIDQALAADMRVTVITLPDAKDPDELIQKDPAQWRNAIATSERIVDYSFNRAFANAAPAGSETIDIDDKKRITKQLLPVIARLPDPVEQSHYLQLLARKIDVDETSLRDALKRTARPAAVQVAGQAEKPQESMVRERGTLVGERLLALALFAHTDMFEELSGLVDPAILPDAELQALYRQAILYYSQRHTFNSEELRQRLAKELPLLGNRVTRIALLAEELGGMDEHELESELQKGVRFLRRQHIHDELRQIERELHERESKQPADNTDALLRRMSELAEELRLLEND